jgi:20S proteasome alpha/beta subunit
MFPWLMIFKEFFLQKEEGITLVSEAICSGIFNDLGSGSNVDVCVITKVCGSSIHSSSGEIFFLYRFFVSINLGQHH